ncbi:MAG: ubiquinol-cytochrome C chaperone family protein [Novosphingobium sp.]
MSFLKRLLKPRADDLAPYRPLWHRIVALARDPRWYADAGVEDSVPGRFDAVTLVLVAVMLRMEREPALIEASVRLTELFVSDMDGQLRQSGVGDLVVGKRMGKLMGVLGGRLGAYREGLAAADNDALAAAVGRNVTLLAGAKPDAVAAMLRHFAQNLASRDAAALMAGEIGL